MEALDIFGLIALASGLVFYTLEAKHRWAHLAFAVACLLGSIYGFLLPRSWPFGVVEAIWAIVALHRWWQRGRMAA